MVTIDHPEEPFNILSFKSVRLLAEVLQVLAAKDDPRPVGAVFISGKPDNFIVGVDIKEFLCFQNAEEATEACRLGQGVFSRISELPFPTIAAINGTCLGGGLELALCCTSRIITDHPKTVLGLPEVKLGLLPGLGGSQRLPRLVGLSVALDMLLTGKNVYPYKARKIGLADEIVSPGVLLTAARKRVTELASGRYRSPRRKHSLVRRTLDGPLRPLAYRLACRRVRSQTKGNYPAPPEILTVVRKGLRLNLHRGLKREAEAFGRLAATREHLALTHVYFASRPSRTPPKAEPRAVRQIGILGGGLMGSGIATVCLDHELTVRQKDLSFDALAGSRARIQRYFEGRIDKNILSRREAGLILTHYSATTDYSGFRQSQVVIEAVLEDLALKRRIVAELEGIISPETVIASNTSSLPIAEIAAGAKHPERIIGMHFFSPVEQMPLLEVVTSDDTSEQALATVVALGRQLGKTVIVVQDSPGFYVNRLLTAYLNEAFKLLEEGVAVDDLDRMALRVGFPIGPCTLLDEVGLDVAGQVSDVMAAFIGERLEISDYNQRFLEDDRLGRKNGRGFYAYHARGRGKVDTSVYDLFDLSGRGSVPFIEVRERMLGAICNEAAYALERGVISNTAAGDTGAIYGFGFPPFLGGPYWVMDQIGLSEYVKRLRRLEDQHGGRFTPAPELLRRMETGEEFHDEP